MDSTIPTTVTCHDCGLTQQLPEMPVGTKAICTRCGSVLFQKTNDTTQRTLALSLTGLILFAIANAYPFLSMQVEGKIQETTLLTGITWLFTHHMQGLSALVLLTSIAIPLIQLLALVFILTPIQMGKLAPKTGTIFRTVRHLMPWSMMEVFLLGILVSMIKLGKMATLIPGTAIWAYGGLILVLIAAFAGLNPHDIWKRLPVTTSEDSSDGLTQSATCHSCSLESDIPQTHHTACPRCGAGMHVRKPKSLERTTALVVAAIVLYIPANLLPITVTQVFGSSQADTIMSGVIFFMLSGSWHIALVIFIASILIPLLKLITLVYLLLSVKFRHQWKPETRTRMYRLTEAVGRWSMVDVYVVTVLVALVQLDPFAAIQAGPGAIYFAAVVVITMLAAESFDPRLIWDQKEE
ncbi:paraquat-inducible protein A [Halodesulfovibrio marinisediminis]|uniref:Paraquat-inducible protein A n=1 Tax=Halodesulfovibrio marinisediminis DSM 17456 TaxID=1121457 RepID=A0A1N6FLD3_9BACT|nr:paraquat-inducible protein A [Halodesulfovibrio marinisediminis]SIN96055.1 paraquat-inducible protein A [Halodesulfovibrio marinisediminis DSM 17456]